MTIEEVIARAAYERNTLDNEVNLDEYQWEKAPEWERDIWRRIASTILSALKAAGLVIVPVEPTGHMEIAGHCALEDRANIVLSRTVAGPIYRAMIRAATGREG